MDSPTPVPQKVPPTTPRGQQRGITSGRACGVEHAPELMPARNESREDVFSLTSWMLECAGFLIHENNIWNQSRSSGLQAGCVLAVLCGKSSNIAPKMSANSVIPTSTRFGE